MRSPDEKIKRAKVWRRRSWLRFLSAGIGLVALMPRKRLSYKAKTSSKTADYWEKT